MKRALSVQVLIFLCLLSSLSFGQYFPQNINFLRFVENKGQWSDSIRFKSDIPSGELVVQDGFLGYILWDGEEYAEALQHNHDHEKSSSTPEVHEIASHAFKVYFLNRKTSEERPRFSGKRADGVSRNYIKGNKKASKVKAYSNIRYHDLYEGIDFSLFENHGGLKYEFHVSPKADPSQIALGYEGVDGLEISPTGQLVITTSVMTLTEAKPYAYQDIRGERREVSCHFKLEGNTVRFELGRYNKRFPLVIDPQLIFSTYSGSTADNWGNTACLDKEGNLYTGGTIFPHTGGSGSTIDLNGFPATTGAFQTTFQGGDTDIGILKFDSSGTRLLYATYIGGNDSEIPTSTITNDKGELFILGITGSTNFPGAVNAFNGGTRAQTVGPYWFDNGTDIIVIHLSADGSSIINSRYVGGSSNDGILIDFMTLCNNYGDQLRGDINVDSLNHVYVASTTTSLDFPTKNAFQSIYGGGTTDAICFKLLPDFSDFAFSTFYGGIDEEAGLSVVRDTLDNVIIAGGTMSDNLAVTDSLDAYDNYGNGDAFVAKFDKSGSSIIHAARIGTSGFDQAYFVQTDDEQNLYILGQTKGFYPITSDVYAVPEKGIYVHKFGAEFDTTYFSTTIGDSRDSDEIVPNISPTAFLINECQNIFIAGWGGLVNRSTSSVYPSRGGNFRWDGTRFVIDPVNGDYRIDGGNYNGGFTFNLPLTPNAYQPTTDGSDFYMMVLHKDADSLLYATYFGGATSQEHVDGGTSRFDDQGIVYQSVCAGCGGNNDFPKYPTVSNVPGQYPKNNRSGNCNNGVFKFDLASLKAAFSYKQICDTLVVEFSNQTIGGVDYYWDFGDGNDTLTTNLSTFLHRYDKPGTYRVKLEATDLTTCTGKDSTFLLIDLREPFVTELYADTICQGDSIQLDVNAAGSGFSYQWEAIDNFPGSSAKRPWVKPDTTTNYVVLITDDRGCTKTDTFAIEVRQVLDSIVYQAVGSCHALPTLFFESKYDYQDEASYYWVFSDGFESTSPNFEHYFKGTGTYTVKKQVRIGSCLFTDEETVAIEAIRIPNIFTPNNDNVNEEFVVEGIDGTGDWTLEVWNRWGDMVFKDEQYDNLWNAPEIADGTYYYLVTAPDGTTCKGWVQVTR